MLSRFLLPLFLASCGIKPVHGQEDLLLFFAADGLHEVREDGSGYRHVLNAPREYDSQVQHFPPAVGGISVDPELQLAFYTVNTPQQEHQIFSISLDPSVSSPSPVLLREEPGVEYFACVADPAEKMLYYFVHVPSKGGSRLEGLPYGGSGAATVTEYPGMIVTSSDGGGLALIGTTLYATMSLRKGTGSKPVVVVYDVVKGGALLKELPAVSDFGDSGGFHDGGFLGHLSALQGGRLVVQESVHKEEGTALLLIDLAAKSVTTLCAFPCLGLPTETSFDSEGVTGGAFATFPDADSLAVLGPSFPPSGLFIAPLVPGPPAGAEVWAAALGGPELDELGIGPVVVYRPREETPAPPTPLPSVAPDTGAPNTDVPRTGTPPTSDAPSLPAATQPPPPVTDTPTVVPAAQKYCSAFTVWGCKQHAPRCDWDADADACVEVSCSSVVGRRLCDLLSSCAWDDASGCVPSMNCPQAFSKAVCLQKQQCQWDESVQGCSDAAPPPPDTEASRSMLLLTALVAAGVFLLLAACIAFCVHRLRKQEQEHQELKAEEPPGDGPPVKSNALRVASVREQLEHLEQGMYSPPPLPKEVALSASSSGGSDGDGEEEGCAVLDVGSPTYLPSLPVVHADMEGELVLNRDTLRAKELLMQIKEAEGTLQEAKLAFLAGKEVVVGNGKEMVEDYAASERTSRQSGCGGTATNPLVASPPYAPITDRGSVSRTSEPKNHSCTTSAAFSSPTSTKHLTHQSTQLMSDLSFLSS